MTVKEQFNKVLNQLIENPDKDIRDMAGKIFNMSDEKLADYLIKHLNDEKVQATAKKIMDIVRSEKGDDDEAVDSVA